MTEASTTRIEERAAAHIGSCLTILLLMAFKEYTKRVAQEFPDDSKDFVAAQNACRAALNHVIILHRFAEKFSQPVFEDSARHAFEVDSLIEEARADLARRGI